MATGPAGPPPDREPPGPFWDRRFSERPWPTDPDPVLVDLAGHLPPGRACDVGSGPGRNGLWLARRGWSVTAVDASAVALRQAAERFAAAGLALQAVEADVLAWRPAPAAYDLVVVANLHVLPHELAALLTTLAGALVPGGHLLVVGHDLANLGRHGPHEPERLLTVDRLRAALPTELRTERVETALRPPLGPEQAPDVAVLGWAVKPG